MTTKTVARWPEDVAVHPAAELFPLMSGEAFADLVDDIRENGLNMSIVRAEDGAILDGRNRLLACLESGIEPRYVVYTGNPWTFVISTNLHRRHLTDGQRAIIAGKIASLPRGGDRSKASDEALPPPPPTRLEAAELMQVSNTAVERARRVQHHGTESLNEITEAGKVPLATADRVAKLPPPEQDAFARKVKDGMSPRQAAPPKNALPEAVEPPKRKRTRNTDPSVISAAALDSLAVDMSGIDTALKAVTTVDPEAKPDDFANWEKALSKGIQALTRMRRLIKEAAANQGK
jgi:hypothetical protein